VCVCTEYNGVLFLPVYTPSLKFTFVMEHYVNGGRCSEGVRNGV
jgi:hypothetical protein